MEKPIEPPDAEYRETLYVTGMTCATCARIVERALSKVEGVSFAAVNLATDSAFVLTDRPEMREILVEAVRNVGYDVGERMDEEQEAVRYREARKRLFAVWTIVVPLMFLMFMHMSGFAHRGPWAALMHWMPLIEAVGGAVVLFGIGRHILKSAWIALAHYHSNMDVLVALGAFSAWTTTFVSLVDSAFPSFGTIGTMIVALHLTGRYIESRLRDRASKQVRSLLALSVPEARVVLEENGVKKEAVVPIDAVKKDMVIVVLPGERVSVDGVIADGVTSIDESMLTGESLPVAKKAGDFVTGGSVNLTGALRVVATSVGEESFLSRMSSLIREAQGTKIPIQAFADRVTNRFVPIIFSLAVLAGLYQGFWAHAGVGKALTAFISTLVIACPCALGLAIPMALVAGAGTASRRGLLIRNAEAIQTAGSLGVVVMDKTGTLTEGRPVVVETNLSSEEQNIAASIERFSTHPLAKAVAEMAPGDAAVSDLREVAGEGVYATVNGRTYFIGRPSDPDRYGDRLDLGRTVVEMRRGDVAMGFIAVEDPVRSDTTEAITRLKTMGIEIVMATGDNERTARSVARRVGVDDFRASLRPDEKLDIIRSLQAAGRKVLMTGDGINDAAALKGADIGVAMGAGSDLAMENADIVIVRGGVSRVADAVSLSKRMFSIIRQNLFWAFAYNLVAVPLAMMGVLNPIVAETAMAISSISVILNSMRINKYFKTEE